MYMAKAQDFQTRGLKTKADRQWDPFDSNAGYPEFNFECANIKS